MREIKFRAWDKNIRCMDYDLWLHFDGRVFDYASKTYDTPNREIELADDQFELMQYTGLHDKNGKEIYEGDIVKNDSRNINIGKLEIAFLNGSFGMWYFPQKDIFVKLSLYEVGECEVIGNIYENPELLK